VKQLAWSLLEARVRAGAREDTPETAAGIAAAYSLLKDIPPGGLSAQQQTLLDKGRDAVKSLADSDARLSALLESADLWQHRNGAIDQGAVSTFQAITAFDQKRFNDSQRAAWNELARAQAIIRGPELGLTAATKSYVPIYVFSSGGGDLDQRVAAALKAALHRSSFLTVDDRNQAALLVDVTIDHIEDAAIDMADGHVKWKTTAHLLVKAAWAADESTLFAEPVAEPASTKEQDDAKIAAVRKAVASIAERFDGLAR
jgi:hypothetical protein